ncbi:hypothetical protein FALBO_918 [Fusarium albosuccineum]|uniref:AA1-like domain-containing protein n=2 Tax=Fusarium decemcellulare species complex TaxID=1329916 RepID=A0A8H4LPQ8_9HYPO|nr:hypothetical protein FALBO_918 [Fusarium albosuccineum]KAJ3528011.1 hypothetical protein NM208_g10423 [Fusarium decemcellulare]
MRSLPLLAVFCSLAAAAVVPRNTVWPNHCCFTLQDVASGATVQQNDDDGALLLNAGKPNGFFCIDLSNPLDVLRDHLYNACFLDSPNGLFKCVDPTPGFQSWSLKKSGSSTLLQHDGDTTFNSCQKTSTSPKGTVLYGDTHTDATSCKKVTLRAKNFKGTCKNFTARSEME